MLEKIPDLLPDMDDEEDLTQPLPPKDGMSQTQAIAAGLPPRKLANIWKKKSMAKSKVNLFEKIKGAIVDGPSQSLLTHMKQYDYVAPKDWPGYRKI